MTGERICAIHQPNLFPRMSTIAKLLAADVWIVLDDVQFNARDYQHRARLAPIGQTTPEQWLTVPVHRPRGRSTLINEVRLAAPEMTCRRLTQMPQQYFGRSRHWSDVACLLDAVVPLVATCEHLADITEASVTSVLRALGWSGDVLRSSSFSVRPERSNRLADLTSAVGAAVYLCGRGGAKYLDEEPFDQLGLAVTYVPPLSDPNPQWNRLSVLGIVAADGFDRRPPLLNIAGYSGS